MPLAGAAFVIGALGFIGVPPGLGFAGYWRLYVSGAEYGGPALLGPLFLVAALDLLCYVRAIHRVWLGPAQVAVSGAAAGLAQATVTVLAVGIIVLGLYPGSFTTAVGFAVALVK
jgi:formate hydrogenlyase subunit 3/multisubunit Na+/H+ antiporter MnhD subunit